MDITEIRMFIVDDGKLKATLSVTFDDEFVVKGLKVIQGRDHIFVAMPSRRKENGEFDDIAHPINKETRLRLQNTILAEYARLRELQGPPNRPLSSDGETPDPGE